MTTTLFIAWLMASPFLGAFVGAFIKAAQSDRNRTIEHSSGGFADGCDPAFHVSES